jgi:ketosteroid isomerase-like protein
LLCERLDREVAHGGPLRRDDLQHEPRLGVLGRPLRGAPQDVEDEVEPEEVDEVRQGVVARELHVEDGEHVVGEALVVMEVGVGEVARVRMSLRS